MNPNTVNERWSMDFVSDQLANSLRFRTLNIVDDCSREALAIEVARSLPGSAVVGALEAVAGVRGYPHQIVIDNGPEFRGRRLDAWAYDTASSSDSSSRVSQRKTPSSKVSMVGFETSVSTSTGSSIWPTPSARSNNGARITTRHDPTARSAI